MSPILVAAVISVCQPSGACSVQHGRVAAPLCGINQPFADFPQLIPGGEGRIRVACTKRK